MRTNWETACGWNVRTRAFIEDIAAQCVSSFSSSSSCAASISSQRSFECSSLHPELRKEKKPRAQPDRNIFPFALCTSFVIFFYIFRCLFHNSCLPGGKKASIKKLCNAMGRGRSGKKLSSAQTLKTKKKCFENIKKMQFFLLWYLCFRYSEWLMEASWILDAALIFFESTRCHGFDLQLVSFRSLSVFSL
jgi:hypothetical protein